MEIENSTDNATQIIGKILADVHFLKTLKQPLKDIVKGTYITSLEYSHGMHSKGYE